MAKKIRVIDEVEHADTQREVRGYRLLRDEVMVSTDDDNGVGHVTSEAESIDVLVERLSDIGT